MGVTGLSCSENLMADCIQGCFVVACTLCAFISLVWLREQIVTNGGPDWLEPNLEPLPQLPVVGGALFGAGQQVLYVCAAQLCLHLCHHSTTTYILYSVVITLRSAV